MAAESAYVSTDLCGTDTHFFPLCFTVHRAYVLNRSPHPHQKKKIEFVKLCV